jgi:hypothetical protein
VEEEYIWAMAWHRAIWLAFLELALPTVGCYVALTVLFFRKGETSAGVLCTFCGLLCPLLPVGVLLAVGIGWMRAARWQIRAFMSLWTALVLLQLLNFAAFVALPQIDPATLRRLFGP